MAWNPSLPDLLGLEWLPERIEPVNLNNDTTAVVVGFTAETTRNISYLDFGMSIQQAGAYGAEIYTEANYLASFTDAVTEQWYNPTADAWLGGGTGGVTTSAGGAAPFYQYLVGQVGSGANANYVILGTPSTAWLQGLTLRFGGLTVPAGQRILELRLDVDRVIDRTNVDYYGIPATQEQSFIDGPVAYPYGRFVPASWPTWPNVRTITSWRFRPPQLVMAPVATTELALWAASPSAAGFQWVRPETNTILMRVYHMNLVVVYSTERRLAWGRGVEPYPTTTHRVSVGLSPTTTKTITAGQRYVLLVRRLAAGPTMGFFTQTPLVGQVPLLKGKPPHVGYGAGAVVLDAYGRPGATPVPTATSDAGAPMVTLTGTPSADADLVPYYGWGTTLAAIHSATGLTRQTILGSAGSTYRVIIAPLARPTVDNTLTVTLRRVSDSVVMGTATLTAAQWDALPGGYSVATRVVKNVPMLMASNVTLAAVQYSVEFTSPQVVASPPVGNSWGLAYLTGPVSAATYPWSAGGYGGATQGFTMGGVSMPNADASVLVGVLPTTPATFAATVGTETLPSADGTAFNSGAWDYANLTWTATALGVKFLRYEIQRQEEDGTWVDVAWVTAEATVSFRDREGRRGRLTNYRIRVIRTDYVASSYSATASTTPLARCCGIGFVSNSATVTSLVFQDLEALRTWEIFDPAMVSFRSLYDADYQAVFRSTELRGVALTAQLLVYYEQPTGIGQASGLTRFNALRALARADLPYVAVLDDHGSRVLAALQVPEAALRPVGHVYYATVRATEVTGTAALVTAP